MKMMNLTLFIFIAMAATRMSRLAADMSWATAEDRMPMEKSFELQPESLQDLGLFPATLFAMQEHYPSKLPLRRMSKRPHLFVGRRSAIPCPSCFVDDYQTIGTKRNHLFVGKRFQNDEHDSVIDEMDLFSDGENKVNKYLDQTKEPSDTASDFNYFSKKTVPTSKHFVTGEWKPIANKRHHVFAGK